MDLLPPDRVKKRKSLMGAKEEVSNERQHLLWHMPPTSGIQKVFVFTTNGTAPIQH